MSAPSSPRGAEGADRLWAPVALLAFLGAWELLVRLKVLSPFLFPPPSRIGATLVRLATQGRLIADLGWTVGRLCCGFALGAAPALALGLVMGRSRRVRAALDPCIAALQPIPKIAILPLLMIVFGLGEISMVFLVALGAFFPLVINTMTGVRQISPVHLEVAENYGVRRWRLFTRVLLPGSLPTVLAGVRLGFNIALLLTIAVEMMMSRTGLGALVWMGRETLRTEEVYAGLAAIAALGILANAGLAQLSRRLIPWQREPGP